MTVPPGDEEPPQPAGHVRSTTPGPLVVLGLVGLVGGWLLRPVSIRVRGTAPTVEWLPVLTLAFVALVMGGVALLTHRTLRRRGGRLEPHQAVNRLVLAKACALAGALVAGFYAGYALSWVGISEAELATQRLVRALLGALGAAALVVASLLLERACRVREDDRRT